MSVLQPGIHALTADRWVQVRSVTGQKDATSRIGWHDAMADPVKR
jgi:hypothetical protein